MTPEVPTPPPDTESPKNLMAEIIRKVQERKTEEAKRVAVGSADATPKKEPKAKKERRDYAIPLQDHLNEEAKKQYKKEYHKLSAQEKIDLLEAAVPEKSNNKAAQRIQKQIEFVKKERAADDAETDWKLDGSKKKRELNGKMGNAVNPRSKFGRENTPYVKTRHNISPEEAFKLKEDEREAMEITAELQRVLYKEAVDEEVREQLLHEYVQAQDPSVHTPEEIQRYIDENRDAVEAEVSAISPEEVEEVTFTIMDEHPDEFARIREQSHIDESLDWMEDALDAEGEGDERDSFGARVAQIERMTDDQVIDEIDKILATVEERDEFTHDIRYEDSFGRLRRKVDEIAVYKYGEEPEKRTALYKRVQTILALHDIHVGIRVPPFDRNKISAIQDASGKLKTSEVLKEMSRTIYGVEGAIGKSAKFTQVAIARIIHGKGNERFESSDLKVLRDQVTDYVRNELFDGKEVPRSTVDLIVRRGFYASDSFLGQSAEIARHGKMSTDSSKYENDPYGSILRFFRPTEYFHLKWDLLEDKEKQIIIEEAFGGADNLDQIMSNLNDSFSSGYKIDRYLEALNKKNYKKAGLWMRLKQDGISHHEREHVLDTILSQDTHMFPIVSIYKDNADLLSIIRNNSGFKSFADFEQTLSTPLFQKLQIRLESSSMTDDLSKLSSKSRETLEENKVVIEKVLEFLQGKKHDIWDKLRLPHDTHGGHHEVPRHHIHHDLNYMWTKTLSISDIPMNVLSEDLGVNSLEDNFSRVFHTDLGAAHQIFEQLSLLIRHPEDLSKIPDFVAALEAAGGRVASQKYSIDVVLGLLDLNKKTRLAQWLPEFVIDLVPGLYASKIQKIRGKSIRAWDYSQKLELMHRLESLGILRHVDEHTLQSLLQVSLKDRAIPIVKYAIAIGIISTLAILWAESTSPAPAGGSHGKKSGHGGGH